MKIRPVGTEVFHAEIRTEVTKLIVAFRNFANAPKNTHWWVLQCIERRQLVAEPCTLLRELLVEGNDSFINRNNCTHFKQLLVGYHLDAQYFFIIPLFQSSTCFEQTRAHHQEVSCINAACDIVNLCKWPSGMRVERELLDPHTGRPLTESDYIRCCINTIDLLMMSTCLLETCRGLK